MAAPVPLRPPPQAAAGPQAEHYVVPSSTSPLLTRAERRCALLDHWRRTHRYRLKDDERTELYAARRKQGLVTLSSYTCVLSTWWVTGHANTSQAYDSFGVTGNLKENLLRLQQYKFGLNIFARMAGSFIVTVPFALLLAQVQDNYFNSVVDSPTPFGGFARYLLKEGNKKDNGQVMERYVPWALYNDVTRVERKLKSRKNVPAEMVGETARDLNATVAFSGSGTYTDMAEPLPDRPVREVLQDRSARALQDGERLGERTQEFRNNEGTRLTDGRTLADSVAQVSWRDAIAAESDSPAAVPAPVAALQAAGEPGAACPFTKRGDDGDFFDYVFGFNEPLRRRRPQQQQSAMDM